MNILNKVMLKTLKKNRTRTIVTIIGIILSAAMFTAVTTFISSLQSYMISVSIFESGDWHIQLPSLDVQEISAIEQNSEVSQLAMSENIGYALLTNSNNEYKPYLFVQGVDATFTETMPIHIISGRLAENSSEIILPEHLWQNGGVQYQIGDVLTMELGERSVNGTVVDQYTGYVDSESEDFNIRETRSYTVVGFYERPSFENYSAPGYTALTVIDSTINDDHSYDAYLKISQIGRVYDFGNELSNTMGYGVIYNTDLLMFSGASGYTTFQTVLHSLAAILIALIMFGSVSLIYNAFSISVSERTKQFGLLASIGATKKQIRRSVFFEALLLSAIGIPLGILSGIGGIGITLVCVGDIFSSFYSSNLPISLSLSVNIWAVLIAAVVALITVLISAWIPAKRATRITAIDAIRQTGDISAKARNVKTSKLTYRLFGLEGMIARKHFKRNRKKYRATVISLFMSIVLFISASSFCAYLKDSITDVFEPKNYDLTYYVNMEGLQDQTVVQIYSMLQGVSGVTESSYLTSVYCDLDLPQKYLTDAYAEARDENSQEYAKVYAVDDETYLKFLAENGLDEALYMNAEAPLGIASANTERFNYATQRYESYTVLNTDTPAFDILVFDSERYNALTSEQMEELENMDEFYYAVPVTIGAVFDELPIGVDGNKDGATIALMYPESLISAVSPYLADTAIVMYFEVDDHSTVNDKMAELLTKNGLDNSYLYDLGAADETNRNLILILNVFSYGFIILISLIAVANVFNTISTNISLRRREFAMLKSVGMTQKGFNKMMNLECLLYGFKSLLWGLPASFAVTYLIYRSINAGYTTNFYVPWLAIAIAIFSVFAVVFATMIYAMGKIKNDNPIDAMRNENL